MKIFNRLLILAGETRTVRFTLHADQFGYVDRHMAYVLEPGRLELMLGTSSADLPLRAEVDIVGEKVGIADTKVFFSDAHVD